MSKKIKLASFFIVLSIIFGSCSENKENGEIETESIKIEKLAKKYKYEVNKINNLNSKNSILKVSNTVELEQHLKLIDNSLNTVKIKKIGLSNEVISLERQKHLIDSISKILSTKGEYDKKKTNKTTNEDPEDPHKYSVSVYFDNDFPGSNIYLTIYYNSNSSGGITDVEIVSGTYGYSFGNSYSQSGVLLRVVGNNIVFEVNGTINTSVGIGDFSLSHNHPVMFTGVMLLRVGGGGGGGGWVTQSTPQLPTGPEDQGSGGDSDRDIPR